MTGHPSGVARFVAFSTIDDEPWESGAKASELLERVRELASLGIGLVQFTEILDCGHEAGEVLSEGISLVDARLRFHPVFRGSDCGPRVPALDITAETDALVSATLAEP